MSHVDEGALHAYLDGALDEYPAAEAERIRSHLEACAECAERLEAERRVRQSASDILGLAVPKVEAPSFEELKAYVRATRPQRSSISVRLYRLGWAASIVLAIGVGWMWRDGQLDGWLSRPDAGLLSPVAPAAEGERPGAAARARDDVGLDARLDPDQVAEEVVDDAAKALEAPSDAVAPDHVAAREQTAPAGEDVDRLGNLLTLATDSTLAIDSVPLGRAELQQGAGAAAPVTEAAVRDVEEARRRAVEAEAMRARVDVAPTAAAAAEPAEERFDDANADSPLAVPGVEVVTYSQIAVGSAAGGIHVVQRLDDGQMLDVYHLPPGTDRSELPPLEQGRSQVWRLESDGASVVLRSTADVDVLNELLARLVPQG